MKNEARKYIKALANTIISASFHFDIWKFYRGLNPGIPYNPNDLSDKGALEKIKSFFGIR